MAIYQDDFQGYAIGTTSPWGSLTAPGTNGIIDNTALPDGLIGPYGQTQYLRGNTVTLTYNDGITRTSGSLFANICFPGLFSDYIFQVMNSFGLNPTISVRSNDDGTVTLTDGNGNLILIGGLPIVSEQAFKSNCFYYVQFNFTISAGGNTIDFSFTVDGETWFSGTWTGGRTGAFWSATQITTNDRMYITNLTIDNLQSVPTFNQPGSPELRVTSQVIELIEFPAALMAACPLLASAQVGVPYDQGVIVSGGTGPYTYVLVSGGASLAALGLAFNTTTGHIHGTPTNTGTPSYTITITDSLSVSVTITCSVPVVGAAPAIVVTCPPKATAQLFNFYSSSAGASGGVPAYTFSISAGALPTGLSIASNGLITGNPTVLGTFHFTVHVVDSLAATGDTPCTIVISNTPPARVCVAQA